MTNEEKERRAHLAKQRAEDVLQLLAESPKIASRTLPIVPLPTFLFEVELMMLSGRELRWFSDSGVRITETNGRQNVASLSNVGVTAQYLSSELTLFYAPSYFLISGASIEAAAIHTFYRCMRAIQLPL